MKRLSVLLVALAALLTALPASAQEQDVLISDLVPLYENNVFGCLQFDTVYWQPDIVIDGVTYAKGIGMHAPAPSGTPNTSCAYHADVGFVAGKGTAAWSLGGAYETFLSRIALAEEGGNEGTTESVIFRAYLDGQRIYDSGVVLFSTTPIDIALDISAGSTLVLEVDSNGTHINDHSVWANASLRPQAPAVPSLTQWAIVALAVLMATLVVWHRRPLEHRPKY